MRSPLLAVWVLLGGCAHHIECRTHGGPVWWQLRTQHFVMLTDLPREEAHQEALDLEELRLGLRFHFQLPGDGDDLTEVVYLADPDELEEFAAISGYASWVDPPESGYIVSTWAPPRSFRRSRTIPHELAHRFSKDSFANAVPWLEEGVASYLESMRLQGPYALWLGDVGDRFGFSGRLRSVDELWALPRFSDLSGAAQQLAYASSWAYVHYLVNHEAARWAAFTQRRRNGMDVKQAFLEVFPRAEWAALQEKVEQYKDAAEFTKQRLEFKYERRILEETELPGWRVHLLRWRTRRDWSPAPEQRPQLKAELDAARLLAPAPLPWPLIEAAEPDQLTLAHAAADNPGDYGAQLWLVDQARRGRDYVAAQTHARAALAIRPNGPSALSELGVSLLLAGKLEEGAPLVEQAQRQAPGSPRLAMAMAILATYQRKCAAIPGWTARAVLQTAGNPELSQDYAKVGNHLLGACEDQARH